MKKLALMAFVFSLCAFGDNLDGCKNKACPIKDYNSSQVATESKDFKRSKVPLMRQQEDMIRTIGRGLGNGLRYSEKGLDSRNIPNLCKQKIMKAAETAGDLLRGYESIAIESCIEAGMSSNFIQEQREEYLREQKKLNRGP